MNRTRKTRQAGERCRGRTDAFGKQPNYNTLQEKLKLRQRIRIAEGHQTADFEILHQDVINAALGGDHGCS